MLLGTAHLLRITLSMTQTQDDRLTPAYSKKLSTQTLISVVFIIIIIIIREEGGRGLLSVQDVVKIEGNSMGSYIKDKEEKSLEKVVREGLINDNENPEKIKDEIIKNKRQHLKQEPSFKVYQGNKSGA